MPKKALVVYRWKDGWQIVARHRYWWLSWRWPLLTGVECIGWFDKTYDPICATDPPLAD